MKIKDKFKKIITYQGDNFKEWFGDMEFENKTSKLYSKKLERGMLDSEILNELKPTELTVGEVFNYLQNEGKKDEWMLFYCRDKIGVLRAVYVYWDGGGWLIYASSVESPFGWLDGYQVFSRNSFDTQTLSESKPLSHSDTLTLEQRVSRLEEWARKLQAYPGMEE